MSVVCDWIYHGPCVDLSIDSFCFCEQRLSLQMVHTIKVFDKLNKPTYLCLDLCFYPFFAPWRSHVLCLLFLSCFPLHPFLSPFLSPSPSLPMKLEASLAPPNSICSETPLKQEAKTELSTQKKNTFTWTFCWMKNLAIQLFRYSQTSSCDEKGNYEKYIRIKIDNHQTFLDLIFFLL